MGERKNKAVRTSFCPVCRSLFCHQTTKPLALVSCAVSMAFRGRRLCLWSGRALQSSWVWLQGAVGLGKQCSPWLPAFSCRLSRTLALLSTCNMATLPSLLLVLLGKTGIGNRTGIVFLNPASVPAWCGSSHALTLSHGNANILLFMLLHFKVFKNQTESSLFQ